MISSIQKPYYPCNVSVTKILPKVIGGTAGWLTVSNMARSTRRIEE